MNILETRGFQLHAGQDIYPAVIGYFGDVIQNRMDSARNLAVANRILVQAEAEGKMYVEDMLKTLGREDIQVTFNKEAKDKAVVEYVTANRKDTKRYPSQRLPESELETVMMGFLPLPR
jgi:excinuclease UvrABC nuclease subunit